MKALSFKRGIHPYDNKLKTENIAINYLTPKEGDMMVFPLLQHIGTPCDPIVSVGDFVLLGQKIGDSKAFMSSPIHSSVSGVVKAIKPSLTPSGITVNSIFIENDGQLQEHEMLGANDDYLTYSREKYLGLIREAGVVGLGGAGFPSHIKLNPPAGKKIEYMIINASECEPYLTTDHRVLLEEYDRFRRGVLILLKMFPEASGIIGVETNKMDVIIKLKQVFVNDSNVTVAPLKPKYPQGAEKQLIYALTKREVPSGGLPADVGCIVHNVDTVIAIDRAVVRGRPLMRKVITITGGAIKNPGNFKVRLGMSYNKLIEETGGFLEPPYKIVSGGPMMGVAMFDLDVPIIKTSSAILCFTKEEAELKPEINCIRCGKCISHCPINLIPMNLNQYVLSGDLDKFRKENGLDCIECGSCSYVCPAKRHLAQSIRATRRTMLSQKK